MRNTKTRIPLKDVTQIALFAALLSVLSQISFPLPSGVPMTLQTFAVALCGYLAGMKNGSAAVLVYLSLGAVGLPVFSMYLGGIGRLIGPTGGFLFGFIPFVLLCGAGGRQKKAPLAILLGMAGLLLCHLLGALQYSFLGSLRFWNAAALVSAPYLLKDAGSAAAAFLLAGAIRKR